MVAMKKLTVFVLIVVAATAAGSLFIFRTTTPLPSSPSNLSSSSSSALNYTQQVFQQRQQGGNVSLIPLPSSPSNLSSSSSSALNYTQQQPLQQKQQQDGNVSSTTASAIKVAFVRPSYTYAAYRLNGFYNFYKKYEHVDPGVNITSDLNLLTVKIPHGNYLVHDDKRTDTPSPPREKEYIDTLMQHVKRRASLPVQISDITDKEVNDGVIFTNTNSSNNNNNQNRINAFNILFLFHQEYVTAAEYENLKQFVANGGTIIFNDANIFTTEVRYDRSNDTVTLVEGHTWQYDRTSGVAWRAERERWEDDNRQWVGSNFLQDPTQDNVTFANNPFRYNHTEEQYVTNPADKIILDFGAKVHNGAGDSNGGAGSHPTVAIYELNYGKGKVISLSIFSYRLLDNPAFLKFYDNKIIPTAFSSFITKIDTTAK